MTQETTKRRRWLGVPIVAWTVTAVTLLGGMVLALFVVTISMQGTVETGSISVLLTGTPSATATNGVCSVVRTDTGAPIVSTSSLDISWSGMVSGDECTLVLPMVTEDNTGSVELGGVTLPAIAGGEVVATFDSDCGIAQPPNSVVSPVVTLRITVTSAAAPSAVYDLTGANFLWVPAGQATACS